MEINKTPVDIKTLIQTSNIQIYDKTKLIDKLQTHFSEEEQKLYVPYRAEARLRQGS